MSISIIRVCVAFSAAATGFMSDDVFDVCPVVQLQMGYFQINTIWIEGFFFTKDLLNIDKPESKPKIK